MYACTLPLNETPKKQHLRKGLFFYAGWFLLATLVFWPGPTLAETPVLRMATTTSTRNSGLLEHLLPSYENHAKVRIHVVAVGTGKALKLGAQGDVDLVMVHAPQLEAGYVQRGDYVERHTVMRNHFVLLGPPSDTAKVAQARDIQQALRRIAKTKAPFVSRGDQSGTHIKELQLWQKAGLQPGGKWYWEVGQGMGRTLTIANQRQAYLLSDDSTYYAFQTRLNLRILSLPEPLLHNPYSVMVVSPKRHPHVRYHQALRLVRWLRGARGQARIASYRHQGRQLFIPAASGF